MERQYKHTLKTFLYIIKFISENPTFTKQDIATTFNISESTLGKYMLTLKKLRLYKPVKRNETEIKNDLPRKYKFITKPWLKEIIFFIKNKRMCPFLCKES